MELKVLNLVTDAKCYGYLRRVCWSSGAFCPHWKPSEVVKIARVVMLKLFIGINVQVVAGDSTI